MDPQTVNLTLSTSGVVPVSVSAYNANTLILSCEGDLSDGTFEDLVAEIYQNANLGEDPLATVTYIGALGVGPHLLTFVPEQTNLLPSAPSILSRSFYLVVRGTGTGGVKTVFALGRLTLYANPASDIGAPPPAPSLYAANVFRYIAASGSTTFSAVGRDDTLSFLVSAGANLSLNSVAKSVDFTVLGGSPWISGKQYAANTLIGSSGKAYICTAAHTSSASTQPETGGQWATVWSVIVSGVTAGDVFGPAISQDNGIAVYSGTTGKLLKASGATVTLTGAVTCDALSLALSPTTTLSAGVFRYDSGEQVPEVGIGSVALKLGVQKYVRAYNDTASAMTKGQAVYLSGAQGNRVAVRLASAASESTSAGTLGLVAESIAAGAEGFVQVDGPMYGLNTLGLTAGSLLYVSSTSGVLTPTSPAAPAHGVRMGYVERVHASAGSIFIKVDNGYELGELHDVLDSITGQVGLLVKNASTGVWEALSSAAAFTAIGLDTALANKADLVGGKLNTSQLPDLALVQYLGAAANQAAMLALVGQRGDWCTRTDDGKTYIVTAEPSSILANWTAMSYPASPVVSVAGKTGAVTLTSGDISGLGALATLSSVGAGEITDSSVTQAKLASNAVTTAKLDAEAVTYAKIQSLSAASTLLGRGTTGGTLVREIAIGAGLSMSGDTLSATAGSGDVVGPASATDNAIVRFNLTTGKLVQDSAIVIDDIDTTTQQNVAIRNIDPATNSAIVLTTKGSGAFILGSKPDGTSSGGLARGARAVDLQMTRDASAKVASGTESALLGGNSNTASGMRSVVFGGYNNAIAGQDGAIIGGNTNSVFIGAARSVVIGGNGSQAQAADSFILASLSETRSAGSIAFGTRASANRIGYRVAGAGHFALSGVSYGTAQCGSLTARIATTDATVTELTLDGATPNGNASMFTSNRIVLADHQTMFADVFVVARSMNGADDACFVRRCLVTRDAGASTVALVGSNSPTTDIKTAGASGWDVTLSVNTGDGTLRISVTGAAATNINWLAEVQIREVMRAAT